MHAPTQMVVWWCMMARLYHGLVGIVQTEEWSTPSPSHVGRYLSESRPLIFNMVVNTWYIDTISQSHQHRYHGYTLSGTNHCCNIQQYADDTSLLAKRENMAASSSLTSSIFHTPAIWFNMANLILHDLVVCLLFHLRIFPSVTGYVYPSSSHRASGFPSLNNNSHHSTPILTWIICLHSHSSSTLCTIPSAFLYKPLLNSSSLI